MNKRVTGSEELKAAAGCIAARYRSPGPSKWMALQQVPEHGAHAMHLDEIHDAGEHTNNQHPGAAATTASKH